jgi:Ion channel/Calcium-activated SK potassium channel
MAAAIRAGMVNQNVGQFHGGNHYRNPNIQGSRYQNDFEKVDTLSESDSDDDSENSKRGVSKTFNAANIEAIEKLNKLRSKKRIRIESLINKLKVLDTSIFILGILGLFLAHIDCELDYSNNYSPTKYSNLYRFVISLTTMFVLLLLLVHAKFQYSITVESREAAEEDVPEFFKNTNFQALLLELLINAVHCPPYLNYTFVSQQLGSPVRISVNELCACVMLLRFYLVSKLFSHYTKWTSIHSKGVCEEHGAEASSIFAIRATLVEKPFHVLVPLILVSVVIFSVAVRIFERGYLTTVNSSQDYSYIWNSMWLVMLTMTTVGYGDYFPRTHLGRFTLVIACFWGIFIISLMIVTMTSFISFTNEEAKSFDYMNKVKNLARSHKYAKLFIKSQLEKFLYYKKSKKDPKYLNYISDSQLITSFYFKKFKEYQNKAKFADIETEEMLTTLNERISFQVKFIHKNLKSAHELHDHLASTVSAQEKTKNNLEVSIKALKTLQKLITY